VRAEQVTQSQPDRHRHRLSCRGCRHSNLRYPIDLKRYQDPNWAWTLTIPRFRCSVCGERNAVAEAHPLPR
jgi:hypothetical protein